MWMAFLASSLAFAGPLGPGIQVRQVSAPEHLVSGVTVLGVEDFGGLRGGALAKEIVEGLNDPERERGLGTLSDVAGEALRLGGQVGNQLVANQLGGGFGAKLVGGITEGTANQVAKKVEGVKLTLDDGLTVQPFEVAKGAGDAVLQGKRTPKASMESFKKKVQVKDAKGNVVKDEDGKPKTKEVSCQRRTVVVTTTWQVAKDGAALASGKLEDSAKSERCPGDDELRSVEELALVASAGHGAAITHAIGPAWTNQRFSLKRSPDLRLPLKLVREEKAGEALCLAHHVAGLLPEDAAAVANRGVFLEALGHHDAAVEAYDAALALDGKLKVAQKARERAVARKAEVEGMVAAYGLTWTIGAPPLDACPTLPEGRPMVVKKGRVELQGADGAAVELSKGERVFVMEEQGGTAQVQLLDGTAGAVPLKSLK